MLRNFLAAAAFALTASAADAQFRATRPWYNGPWGGWGGWGGTGVSFSWSMPSVSWSIPVNTWEQSGLVMLPGFDASQTPRTRDSIAPAIPLPPRKIIEVKLGGAEDRGLLTLNVPRESARVWVNGVLSNETGRSRAFLTPSISPKTEYVFDLVVEWDDGYGGQRRERKVIVGPGADRTVTVR